MELITTCRRCGAEWRPDHTDYVKGTWRVCETCRQQARQAAQTPPQHDTDRPAIARPGEG